MSISPDVADPHVERIVVADYVPSRRLMFGKGIAVKDRFSQQKVIWVMSCLLVTSNFQLQAYAQESVANSSRRPSRSSTKVAFPNQPEAPSLLSKMTSELVPQDEAHGSTLSVESDVQDFRRVKRKMDSKNSLESSLFSALPKPQHARVATRIGNEKLQPKPAKEKPIDRRDEQRRIVGNDLPKNRKVALTPASKPIKATVEPMGTALTSVLEMALRSQPEKKTVTTAGAKKQQRTVTASLPAKKRVRAPVYVNFSDTSKLSTTEMKTQSMPDFDYEQNPEAGQVTQSHIAGAQDSRRHLRPAVTSMTQEKVGLQAIADAMNNVRPSQASLTGRRFKNNINTRLASASDLSLPTFVAPSSGAYHRIGDQEEQSSSAQNLVQGSETKDSVQVPDFEETQVEDVDQLNPLAQERELDEAIDGKEQKRREYRQQLHRPISLAPAKMALEYVDDEGAAVPFTAERRSYLVDFAGYQTESRFSLGRRVGLGGVEFGPSCACWVSPNLCYQPLYYEDANLERFGARFPVLQPAIAAIHFFGSTIRLPYRMGMEPPRQCVYSAGYGRPGNQYCYQRERLVWSLKGASFQALLVTGAAFALP